MSYPRRVTIVESGPRDGLQAENVFVETANKIALVNALAETGIPRIEATSFVSPKAIPALRDAEEVMAGIRRPPNVSYAALVPNPMGAQRAIAAGADELGVFVSASETHNRQNVRMNIEDSLRGFLPIMEMAKEAGKPVRGTIVTAFGCPFEGRIPAGKVREMVLRLVEMGAGEIGLGDTTGMANPVQVAELASTLIADIAPVPLALHFHNTRGAGLANVIAAMQVGVTIFDASIGGMGGCPYAPGATGNICTEDLVHMLSEMGIETGIDLDKLIAAARLAQRFIGRDLPGQVLKAGKNSDLAPLPA